MPRDRKPFGKRRVPVAEFQSVEEKFHEGELLQRRERNLALHLTPFVGSLVVVVLFISPESRAFAFEIGTKGIEIGREWILRGLLE